MSLTIVLSGPKSSVSQAQNALAAAGFTVTDTHDYGLDHEKGEGFVTVLGDDIDLAHETVKSLGWRLRLHHTVPEVAEPSAEQKLAARLTELEAKIAQLEARK